MKQILAGIIFILGMVPGARAQTSYYVDCLYGADGNNSSGLAGSPWKTMARVNDFIAGKIYTTASGNTVADAGFNPGDSLLLRRGCVWDWHLVIAPYSAGLSPPATASGNFNGGSTATFTIDSFANGEAPTIQGEIPVGIRATGLQLVGGTYPSACSPTTTPCGYAAAVSTAISLSGSSVTGTLMQGSPFTIAGDSNVYYAGATVTAKNNMLSGVTFQAPGPSTLQVAAYNGTAAAASGWAPVSGLSNVYTAVVTSLSQGSGFQPGNVSSVKIGAVWGTCQGGYASTVTAAITYCSGLGPVPPATSMGLAVSGATALGASSINFSGSSVFGAVVPGNTFTVSGDTHTYTITNTVTAASNALAAVTFSPALYQLEPNAQAVTVTTGDTSLARNFDWFYSTGQLYVYDSIGSNPTVDFSGGVAAALDGYGQLLNLTGISYVTVQHLRLLNYSWYGLEYGCTSGCNGDHVVIANVYADTEVPFNYHGIGFYFHPSGTSVDIQLKSVEAHRGYYGYEFCNAVNPACVSGAGITLSNAKAYFNRNAGLADMTTSGAVVAYDHCHFYGNGIGGIGAGDTTTSSGAPGGTAGAGNIAGSTDPHVVAWNQYVPRMSLGYQGPGASTGSDTALNAQLSYLTTALGSVPPLSIGIATNFALSTSLISQFQSWATAGYDLNSFGMSAASYANTGALTVSTSLSNVYLVITGTPATLLKTTIGIGGSTDFSYTMNSTRTLSDLKAKLLSCTGTPATGAYWSCGTGTYTVNWVQPCGSCSWVDGSAMLARDLEVVPDSLNTGFLTGTTDTVALNPEQFLADELTGSKAWMTANLTGLGSTWVYLYPATLFNLNPVTASPPGAPWVESTALAAGFQGARGASNMQAGRDGMSGGYDGVASNGVDPQGLVAYSLAGWASLSPAQLQAQIQETVEKSAVWGVPFVLYWSAGYITNAQLSLVVSDLEADGATLMTISGLVNFLTGQTALPSIVNGIGTGLNDYGYAPDGSAAANLAPTYRSPTLGAGAALSSTYQYDVNGIPQPQTWPNKTNWDIGAQALVPVYLGMLPVSSCGPPFYPCSSNSTAAVQTPTPPTLLTGTTGYNEIANDASLNLSGIDPITRLTDSTMLDAYSPSPTPSQGDNDRGSNCAQRGVTPGSVYTSAACAAATIYYIIATYGGCPYVEGVQKTTPGLQVVYPLPAHKGAGYTPATCGNYSFAQTDPTITYSVPGSGTPIIYKTAWAPSGGAGSTMAWTQTALYNLQSLCPLPSSFTTTWASSTSTDITDTYFTVALSKSGGQNTGNYMVRLDTNSGTPTCLVYNTGDPAHTSTAAPFGTLSCTGANCPSSGALSGYAPGCQFTIHDVFGNDNPTYVALSTGGQTTGATCVTNKPVWQPYGPSLLQCSVTGTIGGAVCTGGHYSTGYNNIAITNNPYLFSFPASNANSGTPLTPFNFLGGSSYALSGNCENHFSNNNANPTDTNPLIGATANNNYSTSGTASSWTQPSQNEVYIVFPVTQGLRTAGTVLRPTHTWALGPGNGVGCGNSNTGPFDSAGNFFAQYAIGDVSQDGSFFWWSSSMLGTLGTDAAGNTAAALYAVRLD